MKGKPKGGVSSRVASSTLAYPGNSFKYSPLPSDTPLQKPDPVRATSAPAASTAADTTSTVFFDKEVSGSGPTSSKKGQTQQKLHKEVFDFGQLSRQSKSSSQECDEIYSPPTKATSGSAKDQEQPQPENEIADILQKVEKDIREIELFSKRLGQKVKNGPKKHKAHSAGCVVARDHKD